MAKVLELELQHQCFQSGASIVGSKRALDSVILEHTLYQGKERLIKMISQIDEYNCEKR